MKFSGKADIYCQVNGYRGLSLVATTYVEKYTSLVDEENVLDKVHKTFR